ncbi:MAG: phytoene/squalene synthase family protein [Gemmataceae bacterium]
MSDTDRSYGWCERVARRAAKNFYPAFRLLPPDQRRGMCALYAFLRVADDLADSDEPADDKRRALAELRDGLHGDGRHPLLPALHDAMRRHRLPARLLDEALDGVEQDLTVCRYETFADLSRYCYLVAGTVGLSCVRIWGHDGERGREAAVAAGRALQLTNILRDVGEDIDRGRVYLPAEDLARFGLTAEDLRGRVYDERFRALMRFNAERAHRCYEEASGLAPLLPAPGRAVFLVLTGTYRALLDEIARRSYDVFTSRVRLPRWYKLWLAARALPVRYGLWA